MISVKWPKHVWSAIFVCATMLAGVAAASSARASDVSSIPLAMHLPFDGDYTDDSGNGNDGQGHGKLAFVPGYAPPTGQALKYSKNNSAVMVRPSSSLYLRTKLSVSLWFRPNATQNFSYAALFYKAAENIDSGSVGFSDRSVALFWISGGIHAVYTFAGATQQTICANDDFGLASDKWHNLVFTFDAGAGDAKVYVDDVLKKECSFTRGTKLRTGNKQLGIGTSINQQLSDTGNFLGLIDSVRFYDGVLSASDIDQIYTQRQ